MFLEGENPTLSNFLSITYTVKYNDNNGSTPRILKPF